MKNHPWGILVASLTLFSLALGQSAAVGADNGALTVQSPNGSIVVQFSLEEGKPSYLVTQNRNILIDKSQLGVVLADGGSFDGELLIVDSARRSIDETWAQPWGERREIRNVCEELRVTLQRKPLPKRTMVVVFRVFDDGVGLRYEWPRQEGLATFEITDELTEFTLADDPTTWWIPAYQGNRYEFLYKETPLSEAPTVHTPVTMRRSDGTHLSIHEAALIDYASMTLAKAGPTKLKVDLVPWSDGVLVRAVAPHQSPWRTIQISPDAAGLVTSSLILNLNDPCVLEETDWIEPGKYAGVWWEMHLGKKSWESGDKHGATTANAKKHIDFAAKNGMVGVLVEGWNEGWDGDWMQNGERFSFTKAYPDFDIEQIARYARDQGVRLIGHHETAGSIENYESQVEAAFDLYESLGVRAVKTGYVAHGTDIKRIDESGQPQGEWHHGQYMVRHYRKMIEEAAKHHIMLDVHEPIKDTGERRTYPNMMTREGARGQEYEAWSPDGGNPPDHTTILPFTRMLAGPMDYCPGVFDLLFEEERPDNRVNTTLAKQLALYVVLYSPLQMVPDLPENYESEPEAFQFICDVPTDWEETRVLAAEVGDYIVVARQERDGNDWYLGAITDEVGRSLQADLSFLPVGCSFDAYIYEDHPDTDWQTSPQLYRVRKQTVDCETVLSLKLAPGGGVAIRFAAVSEIPEPRQALREGVK